MEGYKHWTKQGKALQTTALLPSVSPLSVHAFLQLSFWLCPLQEE